MGKYKFNSIMSNRQLDLVIFYSWKHSSGRGGSLEHSQTLERACQEYFSKAMAICGEHLFRSDSVCAESSHVDRNHRRGVHEVRARAPPPFRSDGSASAESSHVDRNRRRDVGEVRRGHIVPSGQQRVICERGSRGIDQ